MDLTIIYNSTDGTFDLDLAGADLATEDGLRSAVLRSLFTDRRANPDDVIPDGTGDRRGSWADAWPEIPGDLDGSRLWLLAREKQLPETLQRAKLYAEEALAWLIEDKVATSVTVIAEWVAQGMLGLQVTIRLVDGSPWAETLNYRLEG